MSQLNAPQYDVQRPTGECVATGRVLDPGETYYAALVDVPEDEQQRGTAGDAGLRRVDVCQAAWDEGYRPERLFSYWRSTVPEPRQKPRLLVDDAVLMNLFTRLQGEAQPQRIAFRYVLALILMRKRLLRYDGSRREAEHEVWLMTPKEDVARGPLGRWDHEGTLEVVDPRLDEAGVQAVLDSLGQVLEAEL